MSDVKIIYQDIAPGAKEGTTVSASGVRSFCDLSDILREETAVPKKATLEPNYWILDGSYDVLSDQPAEEHLGVWSSTLSDGNGVFSTAPELTLTLDALYTSVGIDLTFDPSGLDWCSELTVTWYRRGEEIVSQTFFPDAVHYTCVQSVRSFDMVTIQFKRTRLPYRCLKLTKLTYGIVREFGPGERYSFRLYQAASPISENVEASTMEVSLRNKSEIPFLFQRKQPIQIKDGDRLLGVFYIDDSTRTGPNAYQLECSDALMLLSEMEDHKGGVYNGITAGALIGDIMNGLGYELDEQYKTVPIYGYLPMAGRLENLAQVAFALGAVVDTAGSDMIRIFPPGDGEAEIYYDDMHRYAEGASMARRSFVTEVRVTAHTYVLEKEAEQLYTGVLEGTLDIEFQEPATELSITGGVITGSGINWATITGSGEEVTLMGKKYRHETTVSTRRNELTSASDPEKVVTVKDCTLVSPYNAEAVLNRVYDYYAKRDTFSANVLPGAARPGDRIKIDTDFDGVREGLLISLDWTGSNTLAAKAEVLLDYAEET